MLYLIKLGILLSIVNSLTLESFASNNVWKNIYKPIDGIRDLSFEIYTNELENLLNQKVINEKVKDIRIQYYWLKNKSDIEVKSVGQIDNKIKKSIKLNFKNKLDIITGSDFSDFIKGYEKEPSKSNWMKWSDPTGLKDITEVSIKRSESTIDVIEKKSIGTTRTKYNFEMKPWSKKKLVLKSVVYKVYEGVQSAETKTTINYKKVNGFWLPSELEIATSQKVNKNENEDYTRKINERFEFRNYSINQTSALQWFATH